MTTRGLLSVDDGGFWENVRGKRCFLFFTSAHLLLGNVRAEGCISQSLSGAVSVQGNVTHFANRAFRKWCVRLRRRICFIQTFASDGSVGRSLCLVRFLFFKESVWCWQFTVYLLTFSFEELHEEHSLSLRFRRTPGGSW